jgi:hypothetical protein
MLETNVAVWDRIVRVLVGLALISGFWLMPEAAWRWAFWLGLVPAISGLVGWCPVYRLLGRSTRDGGGNATA